MPFAEIAPYLVALVILVAASAFFSGTEVALFSLRRVDLEPLTRSERRKDQLIPELLRKPDRLIATLLLGNELVNVSVSSAMAGLCGSIFIGYGEVTLALITTVLALPLLLFFGEITPKTIAIKNPLPWAKRASRPLWLFGLLVTPVREVVRAVARATIRLTGASRSAPDRDVDEEEFKALVDAGSAHGAVDAHEQRLIHRVFEFGDKTVAQVMIPRDQIFALSYDLSFTQLTKEIARRGFSRVPIYRRTLDDIRGLVYAKDLVMQRALSEKRTRLSEILHVPLFVPQTTPVRTLFRIFKQRKTHLALVVNEYGLVTGLCTMEDLLEELFGEIHDEREQKKSVRLPRLLSDADTGGLEA